jgi:hypothetical protein
MGVPISHQPYFPSNQQMPDYSIAPILPRNSDGEQPPKRATICTRNKRSSVFDGEFTSPSDFQ